MIPAHELTMLLASLLEDSLLLAREPERPAPLAAERAPAGPPQDRTPLGPPAGGRPKG